MIDDQDQKLQALRERVRELNVEVTPGARIGGRAGQTDTAPARNR